MGEMGMLDLEKARFDTPGCLERIHFNNAGASLLPKPVLKAVTDHLALEARIGGYEAADEQQALFEDAYLALAELIGCGSHEIALVENATRAWDMAFYAIPFKSGDRIIASRAEYASNYIAFLQMAQKTGVVIDVAPCDEFGRICVDSLEQMLDDRVKLVAVTHVPTNGGLANPVARIGQLTRAAGVPFLVDACQSVGQMPVSVEELGCDMLSATGRKYLRGPRGTGFLYVRETLLDRLEPPFLDLHAATWTREDHFEIRHDARRFETWEGHFAGKIGLGVAARYAMSWGLEAIQERINLLTARLRPGLEAIPGVAVHDLGEAPCGIISFTLDGGRALEIKNALRSENINISVSEASSTLLDMKSRGLSAVARASVHYYNSEDEVDQFLSVFRRFSAQK